MAFQKNTCSWSLGGWSETRGWAEKFSAISPEKRRRLEGRGGRASNHEMIVKGSEGVKLLSMVSMVSMPLILKDV